MGLDIYFHKRKFGEEIGYFRKVNFLVKYFEDLGFDVEHQTPLQVDKEMIEELYSRCCKVLNNHEDAEELLPTTEGFFFGSIEYDYYYFDNVKNVKEYIEEILLPIFDNLEQDEYITFDTWY